MDELKKQNIISALKEVYDPEIPINIYDLGLVYDIYEKEGFLHILMTFTSPTCPTGEFIISCVKDAITKVVGSQEIEIEVTFEPMWSTERIDPSVREELGFMIPPQTPMPIISQASESSKLVDLCFNCACNQDIRPLLLAKYKDETVHICTKCISKFN